MDEASKALVLRELMGWAQREELHISKGQHMAGVMSVLGTAQS